MRPSGRRAARRAARAQRRSDRARHTEGSARRAALLSTGSGRLLAGVAGALALVTVVGLVVLWPGASKGGPQEAFGGRTFAAKTTAVRTVRCPGPVAQRCRTIVVG